MVRIMARKTVSERLDEIDAAMTAITLGAQEYEMGRDIRVRKALLRDLRDERRELIAQENRAKGGRGRILLDQSSGV